MALSRLSRLSVGSVWMFLLFAASVGNAQPKSAAPLITVYQDPT
jgi:hypothetical protein